MVWWMNLSRFCSICHAQLRKPWSRLRIQFASLLELIQLCSVSKWTLLSTVILLIVSFEGLPPYKVLRCECVWGGCVFLRAWSINHPVFESAASQTFSITTESCCTCQSHGEGADDGRFKCLHRSSSLGELQTATSLISLMIAEGGGGRVRTHGWGWTDPPSSHRRQRSGWIKGSLHLSYTHQHGFYSSISLFLQQLTHTHTQEWFRAAATLFVKRDNEFLSVSCAVGCTHSTPHTFSSIVRLNLYLTPEQTKMDHMMWRLQIKSVHPPEHFPISTFVLKASI